MAICPDGHQSTESDYCDVCGLSIGGTVTVTAPSSGPSSASFGGSSASGGASGEPCPNCLLPRTDDPFCEGCGYDFASPPPAPAVQAPPPTVLATSVDPGPAAPAPTLADPALAATTAIDLDDELEKAIAAASGAQQPTPHVSTIAPTVVEEDPAALPTTSAKAKWSLVVAADREYYDSVVAEGEIDPNSYPFPPYCPERRFDVAGDTVRIGRASTARGSVVEIDLTGPPTDPGVSHLHAVLQPRPDGGWTLLDPGSANGTVLNHDTAPIPENVPVPLEEGFRIHLGIWTTLTLVKE
jgi:FHA domain